jgi:hypothetical protein
VAPWTVDAPVDAAFVGKRVRFAAKEVQAPAPLGCRNAVYEASSVPPEGLFQGGLPAAPQQARALGFAEGAVAGFSLTCDSGVWEFHRADADTLLFALDNVIWTLSRAYGASARLGSPESVVEALLEFHFNHDYGFLKETADARKEWLSANLSARIDRYFEQEFSPDIAPVINGDPFTDSQEFPTRFAVRKGAVQGGVASTPVEFSDGYVKKRIVYRLTYGLAGWRIDDLVYADGSTFSEVLTMSPE